MGKGKPVHFNQGNEKSTQLKEKLPSLPEVRLPMGQEESEDSDDQLDDG